MLSTAPFETPPYLIEKARAVPAVAIAVASAGHPVVLDSVRLAVEAGFIDPVLVGDEAEIAAAAREIGWNTGDCRIVAAMDEAKCAETAASLAKGAEVGALMKGHIHSDTFMRPILKRGMGLLTDRRISHIFHMTLPGDAKVLNITDAAVNVSPSLGAKVHIVANAVDLAHALGTAEPRVALLSGAETVNPSMPSSVEAAEVVKRANNGAVEGAQVDGPLSFDLAVSDEAATLKGIESPVAGKADILVVPNLESGNFLFKQMVYFMSATAAGIVMGARVPIVLTSRADPPEARLASAAIAAIVANAAN